MRSARLLVGAVYDRAFFVEYKERAPLYLKPCKWCCASFYKVRAARGFTNHPWPLLGKEGNQKGARATLTQILQIALRGLCSVRAPRGFERTTPAAPLRNGIFFVDGAATPPNLGGDFILQVSRGLQPAFNNKVPA